MKSTDITLTLTQEEVKTLAVILYKVGGNPKDTWRRHADTLLSKLWAADTLGFREIRFKAELELDGQVLVSRDNWLYFDRVGD